jgi:hypothetical protein
MPLLRNVSVKDATKVLANGLSGNLEYKQIDLTAGAGVAAHFKKGAFYTATDGTKTWKVAFTGNDSQFLHFTVMS